MGLFDELRRLARPYEDEPEDDEAGDDGGTEDEEA